MPRTYERISLKIWLIVLRADTPLADLVVAAANRKIPSKSVYDVDRNGVVNSTDAILAIQRSLTWTDEYAYDAWGNAAIPSDAADANPFRYRGEYRDAEMGNYYLRNRYYRPQTGRFTQADSHWNVGNMIYGDNPGENPAPNIAAIMQSSNLYVYCRNNPIRWVDPDGDYAREAAVAYALAWYNGSNRAYYSYGQDCANFVSQSLFAGEINMNSSWYSYKGDWNWYAFFGDPLAKTKYIISGFNDQYFYDWHISETWSLAQNQFNHFSDPNNGYINGDVLTIENAGMVKTAATEWGIQKGDIMYFSNSNIGEHHAVIVSKVENGEIFFAAHTNPQQYAELSKLMGNEQIKVIRIRDEAVLGYKP